MRETVRKKLKNGYIQEIKYYSPRSFWDVLFGKGKIEEIYILDKNGRLDGERLSFDESGEMESKWVYKGGKWLYTEYYDDGKIYKKETLRPDRRILVKRYTKDGKDIKSKYVGRCNIIGGVEPEGPFFRYQGGKVVDKGVSIPILGFKHIRKRKTLIKLLDSSCSKGRKKELVRDYREVFPKTEQEKAERKVERMARQKKLKDLKAQRE